MGKLTLKSLESTLIPDGIYEMMIVEARVVTYQDGSLNIIATLMKPDTGQIATAFIPYGQGVDESGNVVELAQPWKRAKRDRFAQATGADFSSIEFDEANRNRIYTLEGKSVYAVVTSREKNGVPENIVTGFDV